MKKNSIITLFVSLLLVCILFLIPITVYAAPYHCGVEMQYNGNPYSWDGSYYHYHGILHYYCHVTYTDTAYYYICSNCHYTTSETIRTNEVHTKVKS